TRAEELRALDANANEVAVLCDVGPLDANDRQGPAVRGGSRGHSAARHAAAGAARTSPFGQFPLRLLQGPLHLLAPLLLPGEPGGGGGRERREGGTVRETGEARGTGLCRTSQTVARRVARPAFRAGEKLQSLASASRGAGTAR